MATYKARNCSGYPGQAFKRQSTAPAEPDECEDFGELDMIEDAVVFAIWALSGIALALFLAIAARHFSVF